jgi:hypothetical protein
VKINDLALIIFGLCSIHVQCQDNDVTFKIETRIGFNIGEIQNERFLIVEDELSLEVETQSRYISPVYEFNALIEKQIRSFNVGASFGLGISQNIDPFFRDESYLRVYFPVEGRVGYSFRVYDKRSLQISGTAGYVFLDERYILQENQYQLEISGVLTFAAYASMFSISIIDWLIQPQVGYRFTQFNNRFNQQFFKRFNLSQDVEKFEHTTDYHMITLGIILRPAVH